MRERAIIHINIADFAVAVERAANSNLKSRAVIIAPESAARASVYDMSEEAYRDGVRKGMPLKRALRICRGAVLLSPYTARYERAMLELFRRITPYSPLAEVADHQGHFFLDTSGTRRLFGPPQDVAWRLRRDIQKELGLSPVWSLAPNKLLAKVASRLVKPDGEYIVEAGQEKDLLPPLPLHLIPGVEQPDLMKLRDFNITHVRNVLPLSYEHLAVLLEKRARQLFESVRGIDESPVAAVDARKPRLTAAYTFGNDTNEEALIHARLFELVEGLGAKLREARQACGRVGLLLEYSDGMRVVRQATPNPATANDYTLFEYAKIALERSWARRVRIRHMQLICDRLIYPPAQLDLFAEAPAKDARNDKLISAVDRIRRRFGEEFIKTGRAFRIAP